MSGFAIDWLRLRAVFDARARNRDLERVLRAWARNRTAARNRPLRVVDLAAGSGNNADHLRPRLGIAQHWTLVDRDARLLAIAAGAVPDARIVQADLRTDLATVITPDADLVTASALLDLVSADWLQQLVATVRAAGTALLVTLSYDGRQIWQAGNAMDEVVRDLVNRHQMGDKGFGPALGPTAPDALARLLGRSVLTGRSDWQVAAGEDAMRAALVAGWRRAARRLEPAAAGEIDDWAERSHRIPRSLTVGHLDQLWLPGG